LFIFCGVCLRPALERVAFDVFFLSPPHLLTTFQPPHRPNKGCLPTPTTSIPRPRFCGLPSFLGRFSPSSFFPFVVTASSLISFETPKLLGPSSSFHLHQGFAHIYSPRRSEISLIYFFVAPQLRVSQVSVYLFTSRCFPWNPLISGGKFVVRPPTAGCCALCPFFFLFSPLFPPNFLACALVTFCVVAFLSVPFLLFLCATFPPL